MNKVITSLIISFLLFTSFLWLVHAEGEKGGVTLLNEYNKQLEKDIERIQLTIIASFYKDIDKWEDKQTKALNTKVINLDTYYDKYIEGELSEREKKIEKHKGEVLKLLNQVNKDETKIDRNIRDYILIEEEVNKAKWILLLKLKSQKGVLYKMLEIEKNWNKELVLLVIRPTLIYEDLDNKVKSKEYIEKYKVELKKILRMDKHLDSKTPFKETEIWKALQKIEKEFKVKKLYELVSLKALKPIVQIGEYGQPLILEYKTFDLSKYNSYFYIPEKIKYDIKKDALYFYIPISEKNILNKQIYNEIDQNKWDINSLLKKCYRIKLDNSRFNHIVNFDVMFCGIGKYFSSSSEYVKKNLVKSNSLNSYNMLDVMNNSDIYSYNKVNIIQRPQYTILLDILVMLFWVVFGYLVYARVQKLYSRQDQSEKEIL